jgi:hypothetical protein
MASRFVPVTGEQICVLNEAVVSRRAGIKQKIREPLATRYGFPKHEEKHKVLFNSLGQKKICGFPVSRPYLAFGRRNPDPKLFYWIMLVSVST